MGIEYTAFHLGSSACVQLHKGPWAVLDFSHPLLSMATDVADEWYWHTGEMAPDVLKARYLWSLWLCCRLYTFARTGRWLEGPVGGELGQVIVLGDQHPEFAKYAYSGKFNEVGWRQPFDMQSDWEEKVLQWMSKEELESYVEYCIVLD